MVAGLLFGLGMAVLWFLAGIRSQVEGGLGSSLETVLDTTDKAVQTWVDAEEQDVTVLASNGGFAIECGAATSDRPRCGSSARKCTSETNPEFA